MEFIGAQVRSTHLSQSLQEKNNEFSNDRTEEELNYTLLVTCTSVSVLVRSPVSNFFTFLLCECNFRLLSIFVYI